MDQNTPLFSYRFNRIGHIHHLRPARDTTSDQFQGGSPFMGNPVEQGCRFYRNFIPLLTGLLLAIVQFVPEMQQKRLKLTLHLPYPQNRMLMLMLIAGLSELIVIYLIDYLILYVYLQNILAPELTDRILLTSLPWYIGGITAYSLTSWICLEPTWKRKILNFFISCGIIRIFFLSNVPQAYDGFIWILLLFTGFTFILPWLSVTRFKAGKQD